MRKINFFLGVMTVFFCGGVGAVTPIFHTDAGANRVFDIDASVLLGHRNGTHKVVGAGAVPTSDRGISNALEHGIDGAMLSDGGVGPKAWVTDDEGGRLYNVIVPGAELSDAAMFYRIEAGAEQDSPQPGSWTLVLICIGFVLCQVRRRPLYRPLVLHTGVDRNRSAAPDFGIGDGLRGVHFFSRKNALQ